jgi:hypothetical protein
MTLRLPRLSRHDIPCSLCGRDFFPNYEGWYRWRRGQSTYCTKVCVAAKHAAEAYARNPDQPCTTCGKVFTLTTSQRNKIKIRPNTGLYCSTECLYASRKTNPRKIWTRKRGEEYFTKASCHQCGTEFVPTVRQRQWSYKHPGARVFCTTECDHAWRKVFMTEYILPFCRPTHTSGPKHPSWKHGFYSREMLEAQKLMADIRRFINQGANQ